MVAPATPHAPRETPERPLSDTDDGRQGVLGAARRFKWLTLAVTLLVAGLVMAAGYVTAGRPAGTLSLALTNATENNLLVPGTIGDSAVSRYVSQRADFLTSDDLLKRVQDAGIDDSIKDLKNRIKVSTTTGSNVLTVDVSGDDASAVTDLAGTLVQTYRDMTSEAVQARSQAALDTINADITAAQAQLSKGGSSGNVAEQSLVQLRTDATTVRIEAATFGDGVDWSSVPTEKDVKGPKLTPRDGAVGLVLGLMLGFFAAWVLADSRRAVTTSGHASRLVGAPLLGRVKRPRRRGVPEPAVGPSLALTQRTAPGTVVVVDTGTHGLSGAAARSLAAGLELQGRRVLLVDQTRTEGGGVRQVAAGKPVRSLVSETDVKGVTVPTIGASTQLAEFAAGSDGVGEVLRELERSYEWVVVDGGLCEDTSGATFVVAEAGSVVVVVAEGSRESGVGHAAESLDALAVPVAGVLYLER